MCACLCVCVYVCVCVCVCVCVHRVVFLCLIPGVLLYWFAFIAVHKSTSTSHRNGIEEISVCSNSNDNNNNNNNNYKNNAATEQALSSVVQRKHSKDYFSLPSEEHVRSSDSISEDLEYQGRNMHETTWQRNVRCLQLVSWRAIQVIIIYYFILLVLL